MFDAVGLTCFPGEETSIEYLLGYMCSNIADMYVKMLNPSLSYTVGTIGNLPFIYDNSKEKNIKFLVRQCVDIAKQEYQSYEISTEFIRHPLISVISKNCMPFDNIDLAECYKCWKNECDDRFNQLKENEEELNRIFIDIYGLQNELTPEVEDKDITVRKADLGRDIRSLISFAVGCMFGRYSYRADEADGSQIRQ